MPSSGVLMSNPSGRSLLVGRSYPQPDAQCARWWRAC
jgi:hypothetical protein